MPKIIMPPKKGSKQALSPSESPATEGNQNEAETDHAGVEPTVAHAPEKNDSLLSNAKTQSDEPETTVKKHDMPFRLKVARWIMPSDFVFVRQDQLEALKQQKAEFEGQVEVLTSQLAEQKLATTMAEENHKLVRDELDKCLTAKNEFEKTLINREAWLKKCNDAANALPDFSVQPGQSPYEALIEGYKRLYNDLIYIPKPVEPEPARAIDQILAAPTPEEKRQLDKYVRIALKPSFIIPGDKDITVFLREEINNKLSDQKAELEAASALKDTPEYFAKQLEHTDRQSIINKWIMDKVNTLIADDNRKLAGDALASTIETLAAAVNAPRTGDEAADGARKECLMAVGRILGVEILSVDDLEAAANCFADHAVNTRVLDKIKLDLPEADLIEQVNADIDFAKDIRDTLEKAEAETIEDFRDMAVKKKQDNLLKQMVKRIKETGDLELAEIAEQNNGVEAKTAKLAGIAKKRLEDLNKRIKEAETIESDNNAFASEAALEMKGDRLAERIAFVRVALDAKRKNAESAREEALQSLEAQTNAVNSLKQTVTAAVDLAAETLDTPIMGDTVGERLEHLNSRLIAKIGTDADKISDLTDRLEAETAGHKATFEAYLVTIRDTLERIGSNARAACEYTADGEMLRNAIETKILTDNPAGDYEYFCKDLLRAISEAPQGDAAAVATAIKATVREYQHSTRATWMDVLVRLYLYSRVPFISAQFLDKNVSPADLARGVEALSELLAMGGLSLTWPELFRTRSDEGDFEYESIRNIDSYVDDVAGHVSNDNVVIDLYCVGILDGDEVFKKPIVSLFN